jgi:hypothetical protein
MKSLVIRIGCLFSLLPWTSNGQNVQIDAEIRPRTEMKDGFKIPNADGKDPGFFTSQRTRLGLTYTSASDGSGRTCVWPIRNCRQRCDDGIV